MKSMKPKMKKMGADMEMSQPRFAARAMRPGGMKKGGKVMKYAKGGGVEMKGKTKGKIV
jgi:hypothetical protein